MNISGGMRQPGCWVPEVPAREAQTHDGWIEYLADYHDAHPGITEDVLAGALDIDGCSPYEWLVEAIPAASSTVVDLACGSGPVSRLLTRRRVAGSRVVGVDQSAGELDRARSATPSGLLVRARATALPLVTGSADAVVVSMALMLLPPLEAVLAEAARLLRPGGTLAATVPLRSTAPGLPKGSAFFEILDVLGQGATDYPETLDADGLAERFSASGLTLGHDDTGLFTRTVVAPDDADRVVRSFYAPGTEAARVTEAVALFRRRVEAAPVRVGYRIRRLVAVR